MCLSSWLLVVKAFPHISQTSLPGCIPRMGSSCSGGALGRVERFLICLPYGGLRSVIKLSTSEIKRACCSLKGMWLRLDATKLAIRGFCRVNKIKKG